MKKYEIIELWKSCGIENVQDYSSFLKKMMDKDDDASKIVKKMSDLLDYDKISPSEFWEAYDEMFGTDPVCNSIQNPNGEICELPKQHDQEEANRKNLKIAIQSGMLGMFDLCYDNCLRLFGECVVGEIGCGYGCFSEYLKKQYSEKIKYKGFDVVKRIPECEQVKDGYFSNQQMEKYKNSFGVFYSCNVFQHVSPEGIEKYFEQVSSLLNDKGYFLCSGVNAVNKKSLHYGQIVRTLDFSDFIDIAERFNLYVQSCYQQTGEFSIFWVNLQKMENPITS